MPLKFAGPLPIEATRERKETEVANRIKGLDGGSIGSGSGNPVEQVRATATVKTVTLGPGSSSSSQADSVHITDSARTMSALSQAVSSSPDIDSARVAVVQQALDAGQYTINPQRIADRLLQLDQDLGSAS
jgi:negative regulator of flagellin synthesis FlgM